MQYTCNLVGLQRLVMRPVTTREGIDDTPLTPIVLIVPVGVFAAEVGVRSAVQTKIAPV